MGIFNTKQTLEEMLSKLDNSVPEMQQVGAIFINYKLQEKLLEEQREYNRKQLFWSRLASLATVALVVATLLLIQN